MKNKGFISLERQARVNKRNKALYDIVVLLAMICAVLLPFLIMVSYTESLPYQHGNTYIAEINDKYALLNDTKEKKIVFVGGSSLPFGLRSDLIEQEISDYKVVNFGLYATLGTKLMMDLSKSNISEGDIVILSPELNEQTYSLYFNPDAVLQACDGLSRKFEYLSAKDKMSLLYNYYKYSKEKIGYYKNGNAPDPIGIYRHDSFNKYGDVCVDRPYNIMNNGVDTTMDVYLNDALLNDEFIDCVNEYCDYVRSKRARIYFGFSPTNELAVKTSKKLRRRFYEQLSLKLRCDLLNDIEDNIIDYRYFYDTNFHLNSSGAIYYTDILIDSIKKKLNMPVASEAGGDGDEHEGGVVVPPPVKPDDPVVEPTNPDKVEFKDYNGEANADYADRFTYKQVGSSYQITGVVPEHVGMKEVILPSVYNGRNVTAIVKNALYGCVELGRIHIGVTYKTIEDAFNGCISLERIYLYEQDGNKISVSKTSLLDGANRNVKIYVPKGANYMSGYTWENYASRFVYFDKGDK